MEAQHDGGVKREPGSQRAAGQALRSGRQRPLPAAAQHASHEAVAVKFEDTEANAAEYAAEAGEGDDDVDDADAAIESPPEAPRQQPRSRRASGRKRARLAKSGAEGEPELDHAMPAAQRPRSRRSTAKRIPQPPTSEDGPESVDQADNEVHQAETEAEEEHGKESRASRVLQRPRSRRPTTKRAEQITPSPSSGDSDAEEELGGEDDGEDATGGGEDGAPQPPVHDEDPGFLSGELLGISYFRTVSMHQSARDDDAMLDIWSCPTGDDALPAPSVLALCGSSQVEGSVSAARPAVRRKARNSRSAQRSGALQTRKRRPTAPAGRHLGKRRCQPPAKARLASSSDVPMAQGSLPQSICGLVSDARRHMPCFSCCSKPFLTL